MSIPLRAAIIAIVATLISALGAYAQTVSGKVVARNDGSAVAGAIVSLIDSSGRIVATKLADDSGSFMLTATASGNYTVRVDRVGYRSLAMSAVTLRQAETITMPIRMATESISLRAVQVNADRRCVVRPAEGLATAQLWEEARKALSATQLTRLAQETTHARRDSHRFALRVRTFSRDLEPQSLVPIHTEQAELQGEATTPFVSENPEILARDGYMAGSVETGSTYFAPDADILLSEGFLDTHCFRVQAPERGRQDDLIGLAFEPTNLTSDRRHVEVRGVLWLDRATAELRYMQYGYVNLPYEASDRHAGGLLEFRPLPDGRWIVWRWYIRTPMLQVRRPVGEAPLPGTLQILRVREHGAEVLEVMPAGKPSAGRGTVRGVVFDSLRGAPMQGVRVFLSGTSFAAVTDVDGAYEIASVPTGEYTVSFISSRLDSLLLDPQVRELMLGSGEVRDAAFAIPSAQTISRRLCGRDLADTLVAVFGIVRDTSGALAKDIQVQVEWTDVVRAGAGGARKHTITAEARTGADGRYGLCGLPPETALTIAAGRKPGAVVVVKTRLVQHELRRLDLGLRAP